MNSEAGDLRLGEPFAALGLRGRKVLFVASTGGHITQAMRIWDLVRPGPTSSVVTFESPQSHSLTRGKRVQYVPYVAPRDLRGVARTGRRMAGILRREPWDVVVSTGAGVALAALPLATAHHIPAMYIESYSRFDGPSLSGRVLARTPGVLTYTQHRSWADRTWRYAGDVCPPMTAALDDLADLPLSARSRIFVTLGTIQPYRFDALVDRVLALLPPEAEITWQLGCTERADLPGRAVSMMDPRDFDRTAQEADIVISHAGVGTALTLASMGVRTILVPRRAARGEHVDDHQVETSIGLQKQGIASYREVEDLTTVDLGLLPVQRATS